MSPKPEKQPTKCPFACRTCKRRCTAAQRLSHRFDCCGVIEAHDFVASRWRSVSNPTRAGYLTGPSKTAAP